MVKKYIAIVGLALFVLVFLVMPFVSAETIEECFSSDFNLQIGEYNFSFEFSKSNELPSLKYLICKYKESVNSAS